jgi:hypothetical protein
MVVETPMADRRSGKGTGKRARRAAGSRKKTAVRTRGSASSAAKPLAKTPANKALVKTAAKPGKKTAAAKKSAAKTIAAKRPPTKRATGKSAIGKSSSGKSALAKAGAARIGKSARTAKKTSVSARVRSAAARVKVSPLPPLPLPFAVSPKKISRSPARRAICATTVVQRGATAAPEPLSEGDLREMMRLASTYIDTWLNRRILFAPEVMAPEDAWAQIWLWLKRAAALDDGRVLTQELLEALYADEMTKAR